MAFWKNMLRWFGGGVSRMPGPQSGAPNGGNLVTSVSVTAETAMQTSAAWGCVRLISETTASLPPLFYRRNPLNGAKTPYPDHPLSLLLNGRPNRYQTGVEFFETMTMQLALHGNAYAFISRSGKTIISLLPMMSAQVEVQLLTDGSVVYVYNIGNETKVFAKESVWHVKLMGNGIIGLSPLDHARNAIALGIANEKRVSNQANNGFKPAGVLMIDKLLKPEQREQIRAQFQDLAIGDGDPLRVLEAGMKYQQITMTPKDVQLLESRRFQLEDICRFFGVPSVLINDKEGSTVLGSGVAQIVQGFYKLTLRPYLERYESSIRANLLDVSERRTVDVAFDFRALLRGDDKTRYEMYEIAIRGGQMTPNEGRAMEGMGPMPGGDRLYMQQQMVPLDAPRSITPAQTPNNSPESHFPKEIRN